MVDEQSHEETGTRATTGRRAFGGALFLGLMGIIAWLFGRGERSRAEPEPSRGPATSLPGSTAVSVTYSPEDRQRLLQLARGSLESVVREGRLPELPGGLPAHLTVAKGCFVTLTKRGQLRGCIGHIFPEEPLARAVIHNARSAALHDSRFSPVAPDELPEIEVEVSVLSVPRPLEFSSPEDLLAKIRPHEDGIVLTLGSRRATFLPQVWEQLPAPASFLDHLAAKAGLSPTAWRSPGAGVMTYQVEAFHESPTLSVQSGSVEGD